MKRTYAGICCCQYRLFNDDAKTHGQKIRLKGIEAQRADVECEVRSRWCILDEPSESDDVYWPHVVVLKAFPEHAEAQTLAIVHVALAGVVAEKFGSP